MEECPSISFINQPYILNIEEDVSLPLLIPSLTFG
jgi:hypothetical protein